MLKSALGDHIFSEFLRLKREEWADYIQQVHVGARAVPRPLLDPHVGPNGAAELLPEQLGGAALRGLRASRGS